MNNEADAKVVRGKVDGKEIYCRVPMRRKRTPISQLDIDDLERYQTTKGLTDDEMVEKAADLSDMGDTYFAGKIYSYLDMKHGEQYMFIDVTEED